MDTVGSWILSSVGYCWQLDTVDSWILLAVGYCWQLDTVGSWMLFSIGCQLVGLSVGCQLVVSWLSVGWRLAAGGWWLAVSELRLAVGSWRCKCQTVSGCVKCCFQICLQEPPETTFVLYEMLTHLKMSSPEMLSSAANVVTLTLTLT